MTRPSDSNELRPRVKRIARVMGVRRSESVRAV